VQHYNIDASKIDVVYNGAAQGFHPLEAEQIVAVRKKITGGTPYFLYIGALHPRKNLERLVRAYGEFRRKNDSQTKLVIAGGNYWNYEALQKAIETVPDKNEIIFTGRLSEEELFQVTGAALALTYVPYFEGFGIPIVEAMACDIPVLTSNITAMPEVGGDAALYVDPFSEESISSALAMMDKDESLRGNLIAKAKIQREKFSWDKTAAALWNSMEKTIGESKK
jgi:glycosyltransferase involved in cell wall biosynthesis